MFRKFPGLKQKQKQQQRQKQNFFREKKLKIQIFFKYTNY